MVRSVRGRGAALLAATFAAAFALSFGDDPLQMPLGPALVAAALATGAVWLSASSPTSALVATVVVAFVLPMTDSTSTALNLVVVIVVFRAASRSELRPWIVAVASLIALTLNDLWQRQLLGQSLTAPSALYPILLTALAVGFGVQTRRVRQQGEALEAYADLDRQRAVSEERRRIAGDLHDVAAHHLTAMVVRNRLALRVGTPDALRSAAGFTATTSTETLASLRQVVRVLGTGDDAPASRRPHWPISTRSCSGCRRPVSTSPPRGSRTSRYRRTCSSRSCASARRRSPTSCDTAVRVAPGSRSACRTRRSPSRSTTTGRRRPAHRRVSSRAGRVDTDWWACRNVPRRAAVA